MQMLRLKLSSIRSDLVYCTIMKVRGQLGSRTTNYIQVKG